MWNDFPFRYESFAKGPEPSYSQRGKGASPGLLTCSMRRREGVPCSGLCRRRATNELLRNVSLTNLKGMTIARPSPPMSIPTLTSHDLPAHHHPLLLSCRRNDIIMWNGALCADYSSLTVLQTPPLPVPWDSTEIPWCLNLIGKYVEPKGGRALPWPSTSPSTLLNRPGRTVEDPKFPPFGPHLWRENVEFPETVSGLRSTAEPCRRL